MIDIFWGTLLHHPAALDYTGASCQHGCAYCFANINKGDRKDSMKSMINFLHKKEPKTLKDAFLVSGYPICISNRSDPFSPNNMASTEAIFTHLAERRNGVFIQTKTGAGCEDLIDMLGPKKAVVYVTVSILNEAIAKTVEPKAPSAQRRLETMRRLKEKGYHVIAAINPLDKTWLPEDDFQTLVEQIRNTGVNNVCLFPLYLSKARLREMNAARKKRLLGAEEINAEGGGQYWVDCMNYLHAQGFSLTTKGLPFRSDFYDSIEKVFGVAMPTLQGFINQCFDTYKGEPLLLRFGDFFECVSAKHRMFRAHFKSNEVRGYLIRDARQAWKENKEVHSFKHLLNIFWNDARCGQCVQNHSLLKPAFKGDKQMFDENGNPILFFDGKYRRRGEVIAL